MSEIDRDDGPSTCAGPSQSDLFAALEEYQEAQRAGRAFDRGAFLDAHGEVAERLAQFLDALDLIHSVAGQATPATDSEAGPLPPGPGDVLGEFRIIREVGRGGMGVVYEAEDLGIPARRVALKVLPITSGLDPRALQRFRVETQAAACLNHPNIVPVFSAGCDRDIPFYAMPLVKGRSLAEILRAMRAGDFASATASRPPATGEVPEPPWPVAVARLGLQAADALEHAHGLGIIHRDIKPSNLIVDAKGRLWVTDFGLARIACNDAGPTSTGDLFGTLRYITPEQIRGEPGAGDPRADIYALGVTLYESVTLRPLFDTCDRPSLIDRILNEEPPAPRTIAPAVPKDLETIILKAMDKLPAGRYPTARALADDLRCFLEDRPIRARRLGIVERLLRWSMRYRALLATGVAGILLSLAIGTLTLWQAKRHAEENLHKVEQARQHELQAKRQAEENLAKVKEARAQESAAFLTAFGVNDMVTVPLLHEATVAGIWDEERRRQSYARLIGYYDEIVKTMAPENFRTQVVAQAARRAGALRLELADRRGLSDYARAIELYEAMSARTPAAIFFRTDLISTLRDYASHLEKLGDSRAVSARRRACEVAEGLLGDEAAKLSCFRTGVITQFNALNEILSKLPDATASDRALAERLRDWIRENPAPKGPIIYLPRP